jgi:hypothetical protein
MFELKLGEKFAKLTSNLNKLKKGEETGEAVWTFNPFKGRYERDTEKWLTDLEFFLTSDLRPFHTFLFSTISLKEKIRKEGQEYQDELNELADILYHNGDKSDKLLGELVKEKEMVGKGRKSFYFQQIENSPDNLIKNYFVEIIKVVELREKSCQIVRSIGNLYQYFASPELLELSSFSSQVEPLSTQISSSVDKFVEQIGKEYKIKLQLNSFLYGIRNDE